MKEKLKDILADLSIEDDEESWHIKADASLIKVIRLLSTNLPPDERVLVDSIVSTFRNMPKWYA